ARRRLDRPGRQPRRRPALVRRTRPAGVPAPAGGLQRPGRLSPLAALPRAGPHAPSLPPPEVAHRRPPPPRHRGAARAVPEAAGTWRPGPLRQLAAPTRPAPHARALVARVGPRPLARRLRGHRLPPGPPGRRPGPGAAGATAPTTTGTQGCGLEETRVR